MHTARLWRREEGAVMVVALIMLVLMGIIGIAASSSSTIEFRIAANERLYRVAFYAADGATEAGTVLLERNIEGRGSTVKHRSEQAEGLCQVHVTTNDFWTNLEKPSSEDIQIRGLGPCDVGLLFWRERAVQERSPGARPSSGGALSLMAGYEGSGKSGGAGGAFIDYDIDSRSTTTSCEDGSAGARARIHVTWRHVL